MEEEKMEEEKVEMIRMPVQEVMYDREQVLGRDVNSVFPTKAKEEKQTKMDNLSKALGLDNSRFISASELEKIKKTSGASVESGTVSRDKSLAAVLAENKTKKEEEFQNVWKSMKQGKNRPLDEDDLSFVNSLTDREAANESSLRAAERSELEAYEQAVRKAAELRQKNNEAAPPKSTGPSESARQPPARSQKPSVKPSVKIRQKAIPLPAGQHDAAQGIPCKRKREDEHTEAPADSNNAGSLGLMLSGYNSEDDQEGGT